MKNVVYRQCAIIDLSKSKMSQKGIVMIVENSYVVSQFVGLILLRRGVEIGVEVKKELYLYAIRQLWYK